MEKNWLFTFFFLSSLTCSAGGLSAWQEDTPYDHKIDHDGTSGGWVCLALDTTSVCFKEFYFYKGCTIAKSDSLYYIINERKATVQQFNNQKNWLKAIKAQNLEPFFKREFNSDYSSAFGDGLFFFIVFFPFPFLLPIMWLCCVFSLLFPWAWAMGFRKHFSWVYPTIIFIMILYSSLPQSI
ncbi:hypothetical protein ACFOWA_11645 [Pedobacter lithocola]|uniref:Uncharacterized protein n=1 Tax=Pedobacter lithocola TaxID=1908239 RepID=A0ABV8PCK8_9SPHI